MVDLMVRMLRYVSLLVLIAPLATTGEQAPQGRRFPLGTTCTDCPSRSFRHMWAASYDGQAALVNAIGIQPVVCLDAYMTRGDLASLVLYALPKLPEKVMSLPANDVVFRVLIENARCPGVRRNLRK